MPVMKLFAPNEPALTPLEVMAYMLFPANETLRKAYMTRHMAAYAIMCAKNEGRDTVSAAILRSLYEIPLELQPEANDQIVKDACVAGKIYLYLAKMNASGITPSLNKATHLADHYIRDAESEVGKKIAPHASSSRRAWYEFMSVAHLWAAYLQLCEAKRPTELAGPRHLSLAFQLYEYAPTLKASGHKKPVFTQDTLWTLPGPPPPPLYAISGLSEEEQESLRSLSKRSVKDEFRSKNKISAP